MLGERRAMDEKYMEPPIVYIITMIRVPYSLLILRYEHEKGGFKSEIQMLDH